MGNINYIKMVEELLTQVSREYDKDEFFKFLKELNYFDAPATTKYYYSYENGLIKHNLQVVKTMLNLNKTLGLNIKEDSIIVVGLFYNLSRAQLYTKTIVNTKVYSYNGSKYDRFGNYEWVPEESYKVKDAEERYIMGSEPFNSYYLLSNYIPLTDDETCAIINQHAGMDKSEMPKDIFNILKKSNLTVLLHISDMLVNYTLYE